MSKNWSALQLSVFTKGIEGVGNRKALKAQRGLCMAYLVRARAGTGKTTTAVELIIRLKQAYPALRILFTVFANRNRADMEKKAAAAGLGSMTKGGWGGKQKFTAKGDGALDICTLNSLGLRSLSRMWGRVQTKIGHSVDRGIADRHLPPCGNEEGMMKVKDRKGIEKLIHGAMAFLASTDDELNLVLGNEALNIDWDMDKWPLAMVYPAVRAILKDYRRPTPVVSFAHQVYVPAVEGNRFGNYDVVIVDEQQDQSPAKMRLTELALAPDGVMIAVGDDAQAIFGFAGADARSTQNFIDKWEPEILPLSITYRCPKVVVESVKGIVPDYEAAPTAPDGEIIESSIEQMYLLWKAGDVCISATNAPTVKHCLAAWRQGKKAMVLGKDFADELKKLIKRSESHTVVEFLGWLSDYAQQETERLLAMKRNEQIEKLDDIEETLIALCEGLNTIEQVNSRMEMVFADDPKDGCILLTSTHKFKGGEAAVIWMFSDTYKPTGRVYEVGELIEPSDCLWYVARTRVMGVADDPDSGKLYLVPVKVGKKGADKADGDMAPTTIDGELSAIEAKLPPTATRAEVSEMNERAHTVIAAQAAPKPSRAVKKALPVPVAPTVKPTKTVRRIMGAEESAEIIKRLLGVDRQRENVGVVTK